MSLLEKNKCPKVLDGCFYPPTLYIIYGDSSVNSEFCEDGKKYTIHCVGDNCSSLDVCQIYTDYSTLLKKSCFICMIVAY